MKRAKSITSSKRIIEVNDNLKVVEYHTIYYKDDMGKDVDFKRQCAKFDEQIDKKEGWKKIKLPRPLTTHVDLPNNCVEWIYSVPYGRLNVKR